jgi:hypothetical protein
MASSFIHELMEGGFRRLTGLKISGTVPLSQDLVNEALAEWIQNTSRPHDGEKPSVSVAQFVTLVRKVQVRAEPGVINVDFEIAV